MLSAGVCSSSRIGQIAAALCGSRQGWFASISGSTIWRWLDEDAVPALAASQDERGGALQPFATPPNEFLWNRSLTRQIIYYR